MVPGTQPRAMYINKASVLLLGYTDTWTKHKIFPVEKGKFKLLC